MRRLGALVAVLFTPALVLRLGMRDEGVAARGGDQLLADPDRPGRIFHVNDGTGILRVDLHRRVRGRGGRSADQQRLAVTQALHLFRHVHHLVERRGDEARQPDEIRALPLGGLEDALAGHHDAQVDDFEVVALEHNADDVLADVMHVALDRGHDHLAVGAGGAALLLLDVGNEDRDGFFHDPRGFHHLRQEHLARPEQIPDHVHAVHERAFDHIERPRGRKARLFRVLEDEFVEPLHEGVLQALRYGELAPLEVIASLHRPPALEALGDLEQPLGRIRAPGQNHILDPLAQIDGDLLVDGELPRVHDPHGEPGANGVVEEHRMHRLAHRIVAAE